MALRQANFRIITIVFWTLRYISANDVAQLISAVRLFMFTKLTTSFLLIVVVLCFYFHHDANL